ncbi:hypothetical protein SUGI_0093140 [Cryptomeria japonica]|uniref:uncharacterized protein LOC131072502 n=1 Tax=Cryptomeria japonica TaxID=3369 RepID=UPI002408C11B|nr:uncharacterized protein LOC131072502 [Cryptomeria japonica]GLJ08658.1 hypothetical protein SUGI_0093140 [Cryptomeria japonica]
MAEPPLRFMNFISEQQLEETKEKRGERVEDGSAQRDRPLFEILKENKDKQQSEFNERLKHRPPKALDDDETEFLEKWEMSKRDYEKHVANEEARELKNFQAAVASHTVNNIVSKELVPPKTEERKLPEKKAEQARRPLSSLIKFKPQPKKLKLDSENHNKQFESSTKLHEVNTKAVDDESSKQETVTSSVGTKLMGLVSYSDESEEDTE